MTVWSHGLLNLLICAGLLVVMPLGLRLLAAPGVAGARRLWLAAATPAAVSVWLPRGWPAALLAVAYLPATTALLLSAGRLVVTHGTPARLAAPAAAPEGTATPDAGATGRAAGGAAPAASSAAPAASSATPDASTAASAAARRGNGADGGAQTLAVATALAAPTVASCALVAERAGYRLFGFDLDVLALTVAHFHYAGFAAALVAGLVYEVDGGRRAGRLAALSVPVGVAVVFVGFFSSEWVELAGAAILTVGMWLVGWLTWRRARTAGAARWLLLVSAGTLAATMLLALDWALGQAAGLPHLSLSWMVATHGLANALGFALCALLAWQRIGVKLDNAPERRSNKKSHNARQQVRTNMAPRQRDASRQRIGVSSAWH